MGNDGGSIPKRHELVKNAARAPTTSELKATTLESLGHAWSHCALSQAPLEKDNVVSDWCGRLFNYEAILHGLLPSDEPQDTTPASLGIRSLRDVAKLGFSKRGNKWICPISMKELGPAVKSVYLIPCAHVFAEVAIKEIQETSCPECAEAFEREDVIPILPSQEDDIKRLERRREALRAKGMTHTLKKDKSEKKNDKKKKRKADGMMDDDKKEKGEADGGASKGTDKAVAARKETRRDVPLSGINNPMTASLTAKVMAEQEELNKRRKLAKEIKAR